MDPVQYMIYLVEQGKSYDAAYAHARQRFGLTNAELEQAVLDAREQAKRLLIGTEALL